MKKDKILITGGTGYIGSHTAVELIKAGYEVEILDNLANSKIEALEKIREITGIRPKFYEADIRDFAAMNEILAEGFDAVMHFAGLKAVAESVEKPLEYYDVNMGGTANLLAAMKANGVSRLIFSSSATVYGEQAAPLVETMPTGRGITNPYGWTKFMIEQMIRDVCTANPNFSATILRYFNPIGAHESGLLGEDPNGRPNNLMPIVMKVATGEIPELEIYGNDYETVDGSCVRDYIHVIDLAKGHVAALSRMNGASAGVGDSAGAAGSANSGAAENVSVYNLGTGKGVSVFEIVKAFSKASGKALPHKVVGRRPGDLAEVFADAAKAERELGWKAELSIDDAMRDTLNFLEKQGA